MPRAKKARASSPKKPRTRRPSTHGGSRAGAGRKPAKLPDDVIKRLGAPPDDPKKMRPWVAKLLAEVQWGVINGTINSDLAANLRAGAGSIARVLPAERVAPADDEDDDEAGFDPELEDASEDDGLRVG